MINQYKINNKIIIFDSGYNEIFNNHILSILLDMDTIIFDNKNNMQFIKTNRMIYLK